MPSFLHWVALAAIALLVLSRMLRSHRARLAIDNLPGPPVGSRIIGNFFQGMDRQGWKYWARLAETFGPVARLHGFLGKRLVLVHDPRALHSVLIKDQEYYPKDVAHSNELMVLLGPGLLSTGGHQHRRQRKLLNPVFSAAHLRTMTHIFYRVAHQVQKAMASRIPREASVETLDINGWMGRTTLEMLGQAGLGYSFDDFHHNSTDAYGESLKLFFPVLARNKFLRTAVQKISSFLGDPSIRRLFRATPLESMRKMMDISEIMARRSLEIIDEKKTALLKGGDALMDEVGEGKDIMSTCLKANMVASEKEKLTDAEVLAQMSTFILAGMDTTSNALSRILQCLAENPSAQEKLRAEIVEARAGLPSGDFDIPYDDLVKLPYLDAVCRETLRLYAPVTLAGRTAVKDMVLPLSAPVRGRDGMMMNEILIPKGSVVLCHYQACNVNPELWGDDALEWKPERWLAPLPSALEDARIPGVYSNLMTFSGGIRGCIGFKFSQLEMKVVLSILLTTFSFELADQPITWNFSAVNYPTMGEESTQPAMLLRVRALQP